MLLALLQHEAEIALSSEAAAGETTTCFAVSDTPPHAAEAPWSSPWPQETTTALEDPYYWLNHYRDIDPLLPQTLPPDQRFGLVQALARDLQTATALEDFLRQLNPTRVVVSRDAPEFHRLLAGVCDALGLPLAVLP